MPNITGTVGTLTQWMDRAGAFYTINGKAAQYAGGGSYGQHLEGFSATLSNFIYQDSGKVYPLSIILNFIIKS